MFRVLSSENYNGHTLSWTDLNTKTLTEILTLTEIRFRFNPKPKNTWKNIWNNPNSKNPFYFTSYQCPLTSNLSFSWNNRNRIKTEKSIQPWNRNCNPKTEVQECLNRNCNLKTGIAETLTVTETEILDLFTENP